MARPRGSFSKSPKYREHRASGRGVVCIQGQERYLPGKFNSDESLREYRRLVAEFKARGTGPASEQYPYTVSEVCAAFLRHHEDKYVITFGRKTPAAFGRLKRVAEFLRGYYGDQPATRFGPLALRTIRDAMKVEPIRIKGQEHLTWSRRTINAACRSISQIFTWAASYEMVPPSVCAALKTVGSLGPDAKVREKPFVVAADPALVEAVIDYAGPTIAAMLHVLMLTGARSGELCQMRGCDIETGSAVWLYRPEHHKTENRGRGRIIPLGPQAQEVIRPFLKPNPTAYLFSPEQAWAERRRRGTVQAHADAAAAGNALARDRPPGYCHMKASNRAFVKIAGRFVYLGRYGSPESRIAYDRVVAQWVADGRPTVGGGKIRNKKFRERFGSDTFALAVKDALRTMFPYPPDVKGDRAKEAEWRRDHHFHPHQVRHLYASRVRERFDIEHAREVLGHAFSTTTEAYAPPAIEKMRQIAAQIG